MDIYSLLNIKADVIRDFPILANRVVDHQVELVVNQQTRALKQIEERMTTDKGLKISPQSIDEVIRKVLRLSYSKDYSMNNWTMRELRVVSYYLMKLRGHDDAYQYAISLLKTNWKNLYFNGLVFYLLNSWNSIETKYRNITCQLLVDKLQQYNENNRRYLIYKNHCNLFEENGPIRMASIVKSKGIAIEDTPSILGFKTSAMNQSYYSDVIIHFVKDKDIYDLSIIEKIFSLNTLDRTKKLVLAHLVERENNYGDSMRRSFLCKFINRILGDVSLISTWAPFIGATDEEAKILQRAMRLVNNWFTQQIIETFFERCVQDPKRKQFWLQYVDYIMGFKIVASGSIKSMLMTDQKIAPLLTKHFIETDSYTAQTSALILFIKDKMLVEFSDLGALYVYSHTHSQVRLVTRTKSRINSISDLKITSMPKLIESDNWGGYSYREEGRMSHLTNWDIRLKSWMERMLLNKDVKYSPFYMSEKEENVFKANPTPLNDDKYSYTDNSKTDNSKNLKNVDSARKFTSTINNNSVKKATTNEHSLSLKNNLTPNNNGIKFSRNIRIVMRSKNIGDDVRVISDTKGFYLNNSKLGLFILLRNDIQPIDIRGNIWIKRTKQTGWNKILYSYAGYNLTIGVIKVTNSGFIYKKKLEDKGIRLLSFEN